MKRSISIVSRSDNSGSPACKRRIASTTSLTGRALCSTPAAPASTARAMATVVLLPVSTKAMAWGLTARSSWISATPSPSGRSRSMRAMSACGQQRAGLGHRAGLADDGDVRLAHQHEGQGLPEREVVVDQHDPDLLPDPLVAGRRAVFPGRDRSRRGRDLTRSQWGTGAGRSSLPPRKRGAGSMCGTGTASKTSSAIGGSPQSAPATRARRHPAASVIRVILLRRENIARRKPLFTLNTR